MTQQVYRTNIFTCTQIKDIDMLHRIIATYNGAVRIYSTVGKSYGIEYVLISDTEDTVLELNELWNSYLLQRFV